MQKSALACGMILAVVGCGNVQSQSIDAGGTDASDGHDGAGTQYALMVTIAGDGAGMVTSNTGGINCGAACTANYDSGTQVTLTATPADDVSRFTGWSGGCSGSGGCVVSLAAATTVTATFARRGVLYTIRDSDDMLQRMDPVSQTITNIGALGVDYALGDCAWDTTNNTLYMVPRSNTNLYRVNTTTGATTVVGNHGISDMRALAFNPVSGTMYAHASGDLFTINLSTGGTTLVGPSNVGTLDAMAWDPVRNRMVGVLSDFSGGTLYTVNLTNGAVTNLGPAGPLDDAGMAYDAKIDSFWAVDLGGQLFQYNPNAGMARNDLTPIPGQHTCLTFRP
jgi:Divergent InlB B-repeat domain